MYGGVLRSIGLALLATLSVPTSALAKYDCGSGAGQVKDEAQCIGRAPESLTGADEDYFADMDYGATKNPVALSTALQPYAPGITPQDALKFAVIGRNNWIVWTGGNDHLWDFLSYQSLGGLDLLKTVSNHPSLKFSRDNRWNYLGLVNEPCFTKPAGPRADRFGLWLDERDPGCPPDPFENETKYPGVKIGARGTTFEDGKTLPLGSYYGYATGIIGLRLFPNPDFDAEAEKNWDPVRYYTDSDYYKNKKLVRPYRVGMSCGFCHVGPNPTNPPANPEHSKWENLNSNPGAQYFWIDRIFNWEGDPSSFPYQLFHSQRPGSLDTSLVSSDYINNPRTMNAIYSLGARLGNAKKFGEETLTGGSLNNKQFDDFVPAGSPLTEFFKTADRVFTPHILKDGADSIGALGSLNQVYVNIGLFSEEWLTHFNALVGGKPITPIDIKVARAHSSYWQATEAQTPALALFFLSTAKPDYLKNAPGGEKYLTADVATLDHGKAVFAERCARCHSTKLPEKAYSFFPRQGCAGKNYLACFNAYWAWTKTDEFKTEERKIVAASDFLMDNFLSTDLRIPVTLLETNACSPLATNAIEGNIWNDFSSQTYKNLPSVGTIVVHDPFSGKPKAFPMPGGGRGYTRVPSLISVWSTAPFLVNNSVGDFFPSPSVEARMKSFESSIQQMLWPEKRQGNIEYQTASGKTLKGQIDVTTETSYLRVPKGFLPEFIQPFVEPLKWSNVLTEDGLQLGPIPKGTAVDLIANIDFDKREDPIEDLQHKLDIVKLLTKLKIDIKSLPKGATDEQARHVFSNAVDQMLALNKCPDFIVNRGHYFGTEYFEEEPGLGDADKEALIAFLKTF